MTDLLDREPWELKWVTVSAPLTHTTKLCVKCHHCELVPPPGYSGLVRCRALMQEPKDQIVDVISGIILSKPASEAADCVTMRGAYGTCGIEGKLFIAA